MDGSPNWIDRSKEVDELEEKVKDIQKQIDELDLSGYVKLADNNNFTGTNTFSASNNNTNEDFIICRNSSANVDRFRLTHAGLLAVNTSIDDAFTLFRSNISANKSVRLYIGKEYGAAQNGAISYYFSSNDSANNYLALGLGGGSYVNLYKFYVNNADFQRRLVMSLGTRKNINAIEITGTSTFTTNDYLRESFSDGTGTAAITFTKDAQQYKLNLGVDGGSANLTVNENDVSITGPLTTTTLNLNQTEINGAYTSFDVASNTPVSDDKLATVKAVIDLIYPIGSIYMTRNDLPGDKVVSNGHAVVSWLGCVWQAMGSNVFLRSCHFTIEGDTWDWDDRGVSGGSATHQHATLGHKLTSEEMPVHSHVVWLYNNGSTTSHTSAQPRVDYAYWDVNYSTWNFGGTTDAGGLDGITQPHNHGDTSAVSSLPPYQNVFIYYRIE